MKTILFVALITAALVGLVSFQTARPTRPNPAITLTADTLTVDTESGLAHDPSLTLVKAQCTACHSSKLILQHRFTRAGWQERIRWMQKNHNLWDLGESEKPVLDYLEKHYGPLSAADQNRRSRRAMLSGVQWYKL